MDDLLENGYNANLRPSGHDISDKFNRNNGAAIPPNLLAVANTESNSRYLRYCAKKGIPPHPARFPSVVPEFFIRFLTDVGDTVIDPFAGSCVTGEVAERLGRNWICVDVDHNDMYLKGARGRFVERAVRPSGHSTRGHYVITRPGLLWDDDLAGEVPLPGDGGAKRPVRAKNPIESVGDELPEVDLAREIDISPPD